MERKELESAATNYSYLRGLFGVPLGIWLIVTALGFLASAPPGQIWIFGVSALVVGVTYVRIARYYDDNYGRVSPSRRTQLRGAVAVVITCAVLIGGGVLSVALDHLPINGLAIVYAAGMLVYCAVIGALRVHHMIIWGALLVAGLLPLWEALAPVTRGGVAFLLAGVATIAMGALDHRLLARSFGSANGLSLEDSGVAR